MSILPFGDNGLLLKNNNKKIENQCVDKNLPSNPIFILPSTPRYNNRDQYFVC